MMIRLFRILPLFLLGGLFAAPFVQGKETTYRRHSLGDIGGVDVSTDWIRIDDPDGSYYLQDSTGTTGVRIYRVKGIKAKGAQKWLSSRAREVGISNYVRGVDKELKKEAGAEQGLFVHGTIPLEGESARVRVSDRQDSQDTAASMADGEGKNESDPKAPKPLPARYWVIVVYTLGEKVNVLEGWSDDLPDGSMVLTNAHRSWRLAR